MLHPLELLYDTYVLIAWMTWELLMHRFLCPGFLHQFLIVLLCLYLSVLAIWAAALDTVESHRILFLLHSSNLMLPWVLSRDPQISDAWGGSLSGCHPYMSYPYWFQILLPYTFSLLSSVLFYLLDVVVRSSQCLLSLHVCYSCRLVYQSSCQGLGSYPVLHL